MSYFVYKRLAIDDLVPGMVLGKMVVTSDGKMFLNEGAVLNLRSIQTLQLWGFRFVDIRQEVSEPVTDQGSEATEFLEDSPELQDIAEFEIEMEPEIQVVDAGPLEEPEEVFEVPREFAQNYRAAVQIMKKHLALVRFVKDAFEIDEIHNMVRQFIMPLLEDHSVTDHLQIIPHDEDYLYHHSVDVGIIAGCLSLWTGKTYHEIEETILGALLHDIGKALIPLKVLNKPGVLTEEEMNLVRFHPVRGYKFLKQYGDLPRTVLLCVLQHHERSDGSGYPLGVKGDKIHPYAKIISVADVFDAMTSQRSYARRATPYEAVEIMKHEMAGKLDPLICEQFLNKLSQRFVGDVVQLSNGQRGEVVYLNPMDCSRPIVKTKEGIFLDLNSTRDVSISKILHS